MTVTTTVRGRRAELGLTLDGAGFLLATAGPNLSTYETGRRRAGPLMTARLTAMMGLNPDSAYLRYRLHTMPSLARDVRKQLQSPDFDVSWALRLLSEMLGRLRFVDGPDRALMLCQPSTTGDVRYDALLAGAALHWCDRLQVDSPPWCASVKPLGEEFIVIPGLEEWTRAHACTHLAALNVLLDTGSLGKA